MNWIKYIITIPFALCVLFLQGLGKCFGLTYKQISVIFNLWIQGGVLVLSGCLPFVQSLMCPSLAHEGMWWVVMLSAWCYAFMYLTGFVLMLRHYRPPQCFCTNYRSETQRGHHCPSGYGTDSWVLSVAR